MSIITITSFLILPTNFINSGIVNPATEINDTSIVVASKFHLPLFLFVSPRFLLLVRTTHLIHCPYSGDPLPTYHHRKHKPCSLYYSFLSVDLLTSLTNLSIKNLETGMKYLLKFEGWDSVGLVFVWIEDQGFGDDDLVLKLEDRDGLFDRKGKGANIWL